ncbi:unnamed protein product [Arabidopsis halleri]
MNDPCRLNLLCSCSRNLSQTIDTIKNIIETCIQKYMSLEETVTYLHDNHKINHHLTKPIWDHLQKESPEFFNKYHLKRELARHITMYNSLLGKQVSLMVEYGALDINIAPSAVKNFLHQDPEGAHLLKKLANTPSNRSKVSPSSVAMLVLNDTNGPTGTNLGAPTVPPTANDQWLPYTNPPCTNLGAPTDAPAANDQRLTDTNPALTRACDPSRENRVMGRWVDLIGPGSRDGLYSDLTTPSWELRYGL